MRIGAATPFGQGTFVCPLGPGGFFYPPPGNYVATLGFTTVAQVFDPVNLCWNDYCAPLTQGFPFNSDGYNWRFVNLSGVAVGATITNAGSGGTNGIGAVATSVSVSFGAAPAGGLAAAAYPVVGGQLAAPTVTQAGSGFLVPPLILIDPPPPGGIQATAIATLTAGALNTVNLLNAGAGYTSVPNFYVVPQFQSYPGAVVPPNVPGLTQAAIPPNFPPGLISGILPPQGFMGALSLAFPSTAGALVTSGALTGSGTLTGIVMTQFGSNYVGTAIPTVTITGAGAAAATALMSFSITSLGTAGTAGTGYTVGSPWISSLGLVETQFGTATLAIPGSNAAWPNQPQNVNNRWLARPARGVVNSTTGFTGTAATIEDPGFGFQKVPNIGILDFVTAGGTVSSTTAVCGGVSDFVILQPGVSE